MKTLAKITRHCEYASPVYKGAILKVEINAIVTMTVIDVTIGPN